MTIPEAKRGPARRGDGTVAAVKAAFASFDRDGYAILRGAVGADVLEPLRAIITRHVDALARELCEQGLIPQTFSDEPFERRLARMFEGRDPGFRRWSAFLFTNEIYRLATHPAILDGVQYLLGPEIVFHGDFQLRPKLPNVAAQAIPWHQDTWYLGRPSRHMPIVTAWVALVDVNEENGCLSMIPGSHRWGLLDAVRGPDQFFRPVEDIERRGTPRPVPMAPGDVLFMAPLTFHSSGLNRSSGVRWSIDLGYSRAPDDRTLTAAERGSYEYLYGALDRIGCTLLRARSADATLVDTWEDWAQRHERRSMVSDK